MSRVTLPVAYALGSRLSRSVDYAVLLTTAIFLWWCARQMTESIGDTLAWALYIVLGTACVSGWSFHWRQNVFLADRELKVARGIGAYLNVPYDKITSVSIEQDSVNALCVSTEEDGVLSRITVAVTRSARHQRTLTALAKEIEARVACAKTEGRKS